MKVALVLVVLLAAACSNGGGNAVPKAVSASWLAKWCQAQPGISRNDLVSLMGPPTSAHPTQMTWSDDHYAFYAFLEEDGATVRQLDINKASLSDAEKAALPCRDARSHRDTPEQASAPPSNDRPACEIVTQETMSAILGKAVAAQSDGRSKCVYKPTDASFPYAEFSLDRGDGAAGMAGAGFAGKSQPGLTNPYDGIGDQAVAVGPALFIRTGDDLMTIVLSGVNDRRAAAKKVFDAAKAGM
jgi:hypothetical protein